MAKKELVLNLEESHSKVPCCSGLYSFSILIKTFTWARDSHGLFDYESKNLTKKNMKTNNPGTLLASLNLS